MSVFSIVLIKYTAAPPRKRSFCVYCPECYSGTPKDDLAPCRWFSAAGSPKTLVAFWGAFRRWFAESPQSVGPRYTCRVRRLPRGSAAPSATSTPSATIYPPFGRQRGSATNNAPTVHATSACGQITQLRCPQRSLREPKAIFLCLLPRMLFGYSEG